MTAINESTLTASDFISTLNKFDESTYEAIINHINAIRGERKSESARKIADLEAQLKVLKASSPKAKTYGRIVNPNNSKEVYETGQYKPWLKELAKSEEIDIYNTKAMAEWVKMKKSQQ